MPALIDSCVILDVISENQDWFEWSRRALARAAKHGQVVVNPIIFSEVSVRFESIEELEAVLDPRMVDYRPIPMEAAFLAGKCYAKYRKRGGVKLSPLPDFFIGAHACVEDLPVVTRDPKRFRTYFPTLELITP